MLEPDCFLRYRISAGTRNFTSGKSDVYVMLTLLAMQVLSNMASPDHGRVKLWYIAGNNRQSLLMAGKDDEMFMTRSFNITPKTTEQHLIVRGDKSVAYVTNNKRLCSTFSSIEANYWQTLRITRPLCDSRATCIHWASEPSKHLCRRYMLSTECPSSWKIKLRQMDKPLQTNEQTTNKQNDIANA